jgi:hypothetical protein
MRRLVARDDAPLADSLGQELEEEHFAALSRSAYLRRKVDFGYERAFL